jgi:hypothetical protein
MGALPINSRALGTPEKIFLLVEDKIRDFPFCFFSWNFIEEKVAEEAPGEKVLLF